MNDSAHATQVASASHIDGRGLTAAVSAFLIWGLLPLYMKVLHAVPVVQFTAHRLGWGCLFALAWLGVRGEIALVRHALSDSQTRRRLMLSAVLIALNWTIFLWGIASGHVVEISLGYFMGPLMNVALGLIVFRERLNRAQWLAVAIAASGVIYLGVATGRPPWVSLALGSSFALYGLVRKVAKVEALPGFTGETLLLLPFAVIYILWAELSGVGAMGQQGAGMNTLLLISGPLTAIPLVLFAVGARRIPLSTVGVLQYIAPTLQLLCAVLVFHEPFAGPRVVGFILIWAALLIYGIDGFVSARRRSA